MRQAPFVLVSLRYTSLFLTSTYKLFVLLINFVHFSFRLSKTQFISTINTNLRKSKYFVFINDFAGSKALEAFLFNWRFRPIK